MNALKVIATTVLSLLLFLSLSVLSIAVLLKFTVLNPDFVVEQVDRVDLEEIIHDFVDEEVIEDVPEEAELIKDVIYQVAVEQEPWIKEQLGAAIYTAYDYLEGRTDELRLVIPLRDIKSDLREDVWEIVKETEQDWILDTLYSEVAAAGASQVHEYWLMIPAELLPPELAGQGEEEFGLYLQGYLEDINRQLNEGTVPEISGLLEFLIRPYYDDYYDEIIEDVPDEHIIAEVDLPAEAMEQLRWAREYFGCFYWIFYGLIGFIVLLVAGIILVNRNVKVISRSLGIDLLVFGALEFGSTLFLRNFDFLRFIPELPASIESTVNDIYRDLLLPLQWFGLGVMIVGILLLVVSFVYRPRAQEES